MSHFLVNLISSLKLCSLILLFSLHYSFLLGFLFNFNISFDLNVSWLGIFVVSSSGVWLDELLALFLLEVGGDLSGGVGGLLSFSFGIGLNLGVSLDVSGVLGVVSSDGLTGNPVFVVLSIFDNL